MKFHQSGATIFVPDGAPAEPALARITHLGIGAHHDDLEFMAFHGILHCYRSMEEWFGGVVCTDGAGSARTGPYAGCADEAMGAIRRREQNAAALIGHYGAMIQLGYPSRAIMESGAGLADDLLEVLSASRPSVVYIHNLADKHETHIAVAAAGIEALRRLPPDQRPKEVLGCEVWRDLDWLPDESKVALDVSGDEHLAAALNGVFDSQIAGGKRYDLATLGRRRANATYFQPHATDAAGQLIFAMNLTPLVHDSALDPTAYVCGFIDRFRDDVQSKLKRHFRQEGV
jgi:LmbE family N-acetylglucosaminyl deacetylase